jgi:site-specific recombinase XerD
VSRSACPFALADDAFAALVEEFIAQRRYVEATKSKQQYRQALHRFRRWWGDASFNTLDEETVKAWILEQTSRASVLVASRDTLFVLHFVDFLVGRGLWSGNPFQTLRSKHRVSGMRGISRILADTHSVAVLDEGADSAFSGSLGPHFRRYLDHRAALGALGGSHEKYLASFERFLRERGIRDLSLIDRALIEAWNRWQGETSEYNHRYRLMIVGKCFDFFASHCLLKGSPLAAQLLPRYRRHTLRPYIYAHDEIRRLLEAAAALPDHPFLPYRGPTYRTYFLTLYTLGLRCDEGLELRLDDIDFYRSALTIRDGKFHKGRVLPFGPRYATTLREYIVSHPLLRAAPADAYLFPTRHSRTPRLTNKAAAALLSRLLAKLGITAGPETRRPGLHSLRHSFAVHRIERWHREGVDLAVVLPLLSAFLGHCDPAYTQVYLTMTPARLGYVGDAFERMYGRGARQVESEVHATQAQG